MTTPFFATNTFDGDGVRTRWEFSFAGVEAGDQSGVTPYLYPTDVKAVELARDLAGNRITIPRSLTIDPLIPNVANIQGPPVPVGNQLRIFRQTEILFPLVNYRDRQTISDEDLDLANRQAVLLAQENADAARLGLTLDAQDNLSAGNHRIVDVAPGLDPTDAVNLSQLSRAIRVAQTEAALRELPAAAGRAGLMLSFDSNGQPVLVIPQSGEIGDFAINLLNAVDPTKGTAMVGHAGSTLRDRLFSDLNPADHGAKGDGLTDDSLAFAALELYRSNATVDLRGRTYVVNALPTKNKYVNGKFKIGSAQWSQGYPAHLSTASLHDYNYNSALLWDIAEINGSTVSRGAQSFTVDERTRSLYLFEGGIVTRYETDMGRDVRPVDATLFSGALGHQGLSTEYLQSGIRLWCTSSTVGRAAVRFQYAAGQPVANEEVFILFPVGTFADSTSCTPSVSPCGNYLVASGTRFGTQTHVMRVFHLPTLLKGGAGDYSSQYLYEFETNGVYREGNPVQGTACDGQNVFVVAGGTGFGSDTYKRLYVYTLSGELVTYEDNFRVGRTLAQADGDGTRYEPEGLCLIQNGSGYSLCAGFLSGQPGSRRFRIFGLGVGRAVRATTFTLSGNAQGTIGSALTTGRYYMALRAEGSGLANGAGINLYSNLDPSNPGGVGLFTNGLTRASWNLGGTLTLKADAATIPLSVDMNGSGTVIEWTRNGVRVGGINVSTINMTLFAETGKDLLFAVSSLPGVSNVAWRVNQGLHFIPQVDGTQNVGQANVKIDTLFAKNGTINTSDARKKTEVVKLSPALIKVGVDLAKEVGHFKWLEDVAVKGDEARDHFGMTVQRAAEIFESHGCNGYQYGALCYDVWPRREELMEEEVHDEDGNVISPAVYNVTPAGDAYSFRMDELHWLIIGALAADQERRLAALEAALIKE